MRVKLEFQSPFITGGKRLASNFIESEDVIRGNVVRAAFAKVILSNCSELENHQYYNEDGNVKKNWVYYRDGAGCSTCKYKKVCKNFSNLKFSYFYPYRSEVIPMSSMVCKNNSSHGFIDILIDNPGEGCSKCGKNSRYEFISGLRRNELDGKKPYSVGKSISTKSAINPYTKTSYDGKLFSIMAVSLTHKENGNNKIVYEGNIDGLSTEEMELFDEIRVGAYLSVGYGKCLLKEVKANEFKIGIEDLEEFSVKYKNKNYKEDNNINYMAIKFNGDCKVNFDFKEDEYIQTKDLKKIWENALEIPNEINIDKVYAELFNYRGYDNSLINKDKREDAISMIQKGSVVVFSSEKSIEEMYNYLIDKSSFGLEQENGFGSFEIYIGR